MKRPFYETELIFKLNPLILGIFSKTGGKSSKCHPFGSKMDQKRVKLVRNRANLGILAHFGFSGATSFLWEM